ncbi:MAG: hypothetical protein GY826_38830 [Fuerstiella sp.]|nr:hypothetical protein [Fuerstiella sp.]
MTFIVISGNLDVNIRISTRVTSVRPNSSDSAIALFLFSFVMMTNNQLLKLNYGTDGLRAGEQT